MSPYYQRAIKILFIIIMLHLIVIYILALRERFVSISTNDYIINYSIKDISSSFMEEYDTKKIIEQGQQLIELGKSNEAILKFNEAIKVDPKNRFSYLGRGIAMTRQNELEDAMSDFDFIIKMFPDKPEGYYGTAIVYAKKQDYENALYNINKAISINPNDGQYFSDRGFIYYNKKELENAKQDFRQALSINPECPYANLGLGEVYRKYNLLDEAALYLEKSIEINQKIAKSHIFLASVYFDQDLFIKSLLTYFEELKKIREYGKIDDFHEGACYAEIARILSMIDEPERAKYYINLFYNSVNIHDMYEGETEYSLGLISDIGNAFFELSAFYPEYYNKAFYYYKRCLELSDRYSNTSNFYHNFQCGWCLWETDNYKEAIEYYKEALKWKPDYEARYETWMQGHILLLLGKYDQAVKKLNQSIKIDPDFENALFSRSLLYYLNGDYKKALDDCNHIIELRNKNKAIAVFYKKAINLKKNIENQ